jgi:hypothetical protein
VPRGTVRWDDIIDVKHRVDKIIVNGIMTDCKYTCTVEAVGIPTETARELRELRRKNRALEQTKSSRPHQIFFARAARRATPLICAFIGEHR